MQIFKAELDAAQVSLKECRARISSLQQQCQEQQQQLLSTHLDLEAARSELAMCRTELKQVPMLQQQLFDRQQRLQQLQVQKSSQTAPVDHCSIMIIAVFMVPCQADALLLDAVHWGSRCAAFQGF